MKTQALRPGSGQAAPTQALAGDANQLASLRSRAAADPKTAAREVAKQFEALFMRELLKSMREATPATGLFDNQATKLGQEMLDAQIVTQVSGGQGSLTALIAKQLERQMGAGVGDMVKQVITPDRTSASATSSAGSVTSTRSTSTPRIPEQRAADFLAQHRAAAQAAQAATGIPANFMLAQAAHESGWGQRGIARADGTSSHNLFGIKAGAGWTGAVAEVTTTEYVGGQPHKMVQRFRAYASADEAFADYARLMRESPRYQGVIASGADARGFAQNLQRAGYATDPQYAAKLERVIETTNRLQRGGV
jgi:peptidoglycan hydrolase FlgJ